MTAGIYAITSPSGRQYIGSASNVASRWSKHRSDLRRGKHHCQPLQAASNKYGIENLKFEVIVYLEDITTLIVFEQAAFAAYRPEYNVLPTAYSHLGAKRSAESCERIRAAATGRKASPEARAKMAAAKRGRTLSDEHKQKIALALSGVPKSIESREKLSASKTGVKHSPERIAKNSAAHMGQERSPEAIAKFRATLAANRAAKAAESSEALTP